MRKIDFDTFNQKKFANSCGFRGGATLKSLSIAALAGCAIIGCAQGAYAADIVLGSDEANELLKTKTIDQPTLDYLKDNNILIPQKGEWISTDKTWGTAAPIPSRGSAYTITEGSAEDYAFEYKTTDDGQNVNTQYYKVDIAGSIPNPDTYEYITPEGYTETSSRILNLDDSNANKKVFIGIENIGLSGDGGGAIMNQNNHNNNSIISDFVNNSITASTFKYGGAIFNKRSELKSIKGDFIGNSVTNTNTFAYGGAICNNNAATIGEITGNFINNYVEAKAVARGGAIINYQNNSEIGFITGNFINNSITSSNDATKGGAIYNERAIISNITGHFVGNSAAGALDSNGGAIVNWSGTVANITGDFISNTVSSDTTSGYGGAIYNRTGSFVGDITGDFIANSAKSDGKNAAGGAVYNYDKSIIGNILGSFINNNAESPSKNNVQGGAIYNNNSAKIGNISGDFISNNVVGFNADGGAIYNDTNSVIGDITGDFIANYATSNSTSTELLGSGRGQGGAIYNFNNSTIGKIEGNFIDNHVKGNNAYGGAILNISGSRGVASIKGIEGNFIGNTVSSGSNKGQGGAIANYGNIGDIKGNFAENEVVAGMHADGGAVYNYQDCEIGNITGNFVNNVARSRDNVGHGEGAGVYNWAGTIGNIKGDFINNYVSGNKAYGAAIFNSDDVVTAKTGKIGNITGNFINNRSEAVSDVSQGGAVYNYSKIGNISGSFINNYAKSEAGTAQGGAIYTKADMDFVADGVVNTFKGNYTESNGVKDDNAIWVEKANDDTLPTLTFKTENNGKFAMYDNINGTKGYAVNITGDGTGTFEMYNDMSNAQLSIGNNNIIVMDNDTHTYNVEKLTITGDVEIPVVDICLADKSMDRFAAKEYGEHSGKLNVSALNYVNSSEIPTEAKIEILFADKGLKDNVTESVSGQTLMTPIYKYGVMYDNRKDGGYFVFNSGLSAGNNPSRAFNPAVLASPVSTIASAQSVVNETFKHVFEHADAFTKLPYSTRLTMLNQNKYAINDGYNHFTNTPLTEKAGWFRPYVTFENMHLNNGPRVDAINYGSLMGFDTDFRSHRNGWYSVGTGYVGYNGSNLSYSGVDVVSNGGMLGYTQTMYKGNFWTAMTVNAGASVAQARTMYGNEDFTSLMAGLGSKTGYNFEFKDGKYILQPMMFMSYSFVNTFDYTNAAGVRMDSKPAHCMQLNPSIRFITNTKNGWQPYAHVGMVWNVLNSSETLANKVKLPQMSVKPYIEYGLGLQKTWKDKFTAFGQVMLRNGGRNGVAMTGGFRWMIDDRKAQKVQNDAPKKVVLKQLSPQQKIVLGAKYQNTTRTTSVAVLKLL